MKKLYYLLLFITIFVPQIVLASPNASISTGSNSIEKGNSVTVTVTVTDTASWNIKIAGSGAATCQEKYADVTADALSTTKTFSLSCTSTTEGTINFAVTGDITSGDGITKDISLSKQVSVVPPKSSDNTLKELKVDGTMVSGFSSSKTSYTINDYSGTSVNITATPNDSKATVTGTGSKSLNYGKNSFNIVVTAENGSKKTYTIAVTKADSRSSNNYLKSITLNVGTIEFDKNTTNYSIKLEHDVNEIIISAEAEDSKATIKGTGTKSLNDYSNSFNIIVKAENGAEKTYTINAIRKDSSGNYGALSKDNSVESISITGSDFKFSNDIKKYNILVEDVDNVDINVKTKDSSATVNIQNNDSLKVGLNKVTVQVIAENGDINEFLFNIYKIGEENEIIEKNPEPEHNVAEENKGSNIWMYLSIIEFIFIGALIVKLTKRK